MTVAVEEQRRPVDTTVRTPDNHVIVLFGASGDLARRKLLPGLFHLSEAGLMPRDYRIVGCSRHGLSDEEFRSVAREAVAKFGRRPATDECWDPFAARLTYVGTAEGLGELRKTVELAKEEIREDTGVEPRILHYVSVPPNAAAGVVEELGICGLGERARVIMEKPFGVDLESARRLNATVHRVFDESQVFRIDHFLGKEAVQNILALRFANGLFEPVWNRDHVNHIQIDVPETLSVGTRGGFYEQTGAYRDMVVTHIFQVLGFVAMEPPTSITSDALLIEKRKVFDTIEPLDPGEVVRGQYEGYREIPGVTPGSDTETFVALKAEVDSWRWAGVPFYLRTGKRLHRSGHAITIAFHEPPRRVFELAPHVNDPNLLTFELGEPGSITASFLAKEPGATMRLGAAKMTFEYEESFSTAMQLEAYERLMHDAMIGDRLLFTSADGIERLWEISEPLLQSPPPAHPYPPGSWGPPEADALVAPHHWHLSEHG
jgi:glucose-6-phosphate 1-dehydrogenase